MSFKDDLDDDLTEVFFETGLDGLGNDSSEFALDVTYRPLSGGSYTVSAIFDRETVEHVPSDESNGAVRFLTQDTKIMVKEADITGGVKKGDEVTISGQEYVISEHYSDGVGVLTLILHKS